MRNFFSGAFKDNSNLSYGFLTGILRIAQESIFSGLNNLTVNSVMDEEYDGFFGFTESEVVEMLAYYGASDKKEELQGDGAWLCEVSIPNREIAAVYKREILSHLMEIGAMGKAAVNKIAESLYAQDTKKLQDGINQYALRLSHTLRSH